MTILFFLLIPSSLLPSSSPSIDSSTTMGRPTLPISAFPIFKSPITKRSDKYRYAVKLSWTWLDRWLKQYDAVAQSNIKFPPPRFHSSSITNDNWPTGGCCNGDESPWVINRRVSFPSSEAWPSFYFHPLRAATTWRKRRTIRPAQFSNLFFSRADRIPFDRVEGKRIFENSAFLFGFGWTRRGTNDRV